MWSSFCDLHPVAHMLIGASAPSENSDAGLARLILLTKLVDRLAEGEYAFATNLQSDDPEIRCAFERKADAERIGNALGTYQCVGYPTGATRRWFRLEKAALDA